MFGRFIITALSLLGSALAQEPGSCFGCQMGSYCDNYNGDLHYSSATYYLADNWLAAFGNSGDLQPEMGRAVCDADWCQILSNYAGDVRGYNYDQAQGAVDFVKSGNVDGCSHFRQQFIDTGNPDTSDYYLRFETISSWYSCGYDDDGNLQSIVDYYGGPGTVFEGPFCGSFA